MFVLSAPVIYSLELTALCHSHCPVCSNVFERKPHALSAGEWGRVLDRIAPQAETLKLTGGEPTLHPEFSEIVRLVAAKDLPFALFTNGRWANPRSIIDLLRATPQCRGLLISLHGPDNVTHEQFTQTAGSFEEACENIRRATAAGLKVHTSTVITRHNWAQLSRIIGLAQDLGARRAVFNRYLGPANPELEPKEWQLRRASLDLEKLIRQANATPSSPFTIRHGTCLPQCFISSSATGCWAGTAYCTIDPWGNLRPCNHSPLIVGNILNTPLEQLWHSQAMNSWRKLLPQQCQSCHQLHVCRGGCRALIEIRDEDPLIRQPIQRESHPLSITLYEKSRPILNCKIQEESFGYALIRSHTIMPLTAQAKPVLDRLTGQFTLRQIELDFGAEALNLVGSLYHHGLLILEE